MNRILSCGVLALAAAMIGCDDDAGGGATPDGGASADGNGLAADGNGLTADANGLAKDSGSPNTSGNLTCSPTSANFANADGGVELTAGARVCYTWAAEGAPASCAVLYDTAAVRMRCPATSGDLLAFGPEFNVPTWRAVTVSDDPPRRIRSSSHGVLNNNALRAEVNGLPTGTEITVTIQPSAYWSARGLEDYVVKARIDPPVVTVISVSRAPAPQP